MDNINKHTLYLSGLIAGAIVNNEHWKIFGFKKRPKRGKIFERFINQSELIKENFLIKELFLLSTIDVIEAIKKKDIAEEDKLLYVVGVLSRLSLPSLQSNIFNDDIGLAEFLRNGIKDYLNKPFIESFSLRAKKSIDENSAKSLIAHCMIIAAFNDQKKGLILDRHIIAQEISPIEREEKLETSLDNNQLKIYTDLAQEIMDY
ncbi:MAG: hypothetical protein WC309_01275 [Candidatus Paceibacterota bacterium]